MTFIYDEGVDILYAFFGKPEHSIYDPMGEGIYLRKDPISGNYIGFMILDYAKRFENNPPLIPNFENIGIPPLNEISI